jgi:hypothetical protein
VVLKCWNAKDPFSADRLMNKISNEKYDWNDLQRLVRPHLLPPYRRIINDVLSHYIYLRDLDENLIQIAADSRAHKKKVLVKKVIDELAPQH